MTTFRQQQREYTLIKLYLQLKQKDPFINSLIYGMQVQCYQMEMDYSYIATLYLHENNPEILISINAFGEISTFDVKKIQLKNQVEIGGEKSQRMKMRKGAWLVLQDLGTGMCILFDTKEEREKFQDSFYQIIQKMCEIPSETDSEILKSFIKADSNRNRTMDYKELMQMFRELKICNEQDQKRICKFIGISDKKENAMITFQEFQKLSMYLACRKQFMHDFETFTGYKFKDKKAFFQKVMRKQNFITFLRQVQQQSLEQAKNIAAKIFAGSNLKISFCDFCYYMIGQTNNILSDEYRSHPQDLNHPLNHYYCYSSHNTYLTGHQLYGQSRASRYYDDLSNGVRCVEIDTHNDSDGPIVKHGGTMTSKILFQDVLEQIRVFCVEREEKFTPIIISIQNNCNLENQQRMADSLVKILGKRIFVIKDYLESIKKDKVTKFPTLKQLMGRIVIKCNGNWQLYSNFILSNKKNTGLVAEIVVQDEAHSQEQPSNKKPKCGDKEVQKQVTVQINLDLLRVTSMLGKGAFGKPHIWESVSLNENKIKACYTSAQQDGLEHTKNGWIRSYPLGSRFDSSNYNPFPAIEMGVQIIAINTQSSDYSTILMRTFFQKSSHIATGYRPTMHHPNLLQRKKAKKIGIRPISAMKIYFNEAQRRRETPPCEIRMRLYCYSEDMYKNPKTIVWKSYTEQITENGFNPVFSRPETMRVQYTVDWLAFVVVEIQGAGIGVIPIESLKKGYRYVELYDNQMRRKESKVFFIIS